MKYEGRWYSNPGDIAALYVFAVDLAADGTAVWQGEAPIPAEWTVNGDEPTLSLGKRQEIIAGPLGEKDRAIRCVPHAEAE